MKKQSTREVISIHEQRNILSAFAAPFLIAVGLLVAIWVLVN